MWAISSPVWERSKYQLWFLFVFKDATKIVVILTLDKIGRCFHIWSNFANISESNNCKSSQRQTWTLCKINKNDWRVPSSVPTKMYCRHVLWGNRIFYNSNHIYLTLYLVNVCFWRNVHVHCMFCRIQSIFLFPWLWNVFFIIIRLMDTAREMIKESLPIKCLEAVIVGLYPNLRWFIF